MEAMERLRNRFLNVRLSSVSHPPSAYARKAAAEQQSAADAAHEVQEKELVTQQWFERGLAAVDVDEM